MDALLVEDVVAAPDEETEKLVSEMVREEQDMMHGFSEQEKQLHKVLLEKYDKETVGAAVRWLWRRVFFPASFRKMMPHGEEELKLDEETKKAVQDLAKAERRGYGNFQKRERELYAMIAEKYGKETASQVLRRLWIYSAGMDFEEE